MLEKRAADDYRFIYDENYFIDPSMPPICLTLPKSERAHKSVMLFPFFAGLLAEGINKNIQCRLLRIDENDDFTRLLRTATGDAIGAIAVKEVRD